MFYVDCLIVIAVNLLRVDDESLESLEVLEVLVYNLEYLSL